MKKRYLCAGIVLMMLLSLAMVPVDAANGGSYSQAMLKEISKLEKCAIDMLEVTGDDVPELIYAKKVRLGSEVHVFQYIPGGLKEILTETVGSDPRDDAEDPIILKIWTLDDSMIICDICPSPHVTVTQYSRYTYDKNELEMYKNDMLVEFDYGSASSQESKEERASDGKKYYHGTDIVVDFNAASPEITTEGQGIEEIEENDFVEKLSGFMKIEEEEAFDFLEKMDLAIKVTKTGPQYYGLGKESAQKWIDENKSIFNERANKLVNKLEKENPLPFTDVKMNAWYYNDVKRAVGTGLINGYVEKNGTFYKPDKNMTYAEAVKLAAVMHKLASTGSSDFQSGKPWYQPYVEYAKENGIISKDYDWNEAATRAGYIEIFANAIPDEPVNEEIKALTAMNTVADGAIPDVPKEHPQAEAIYKLYRAGILQGSDDQHNCKPDTNIRRSEVAAILTRMMNANERIEFSIEEK